MSLFVRNKSPKRAILLLGFPFLLGYSLLFSYSLQVGLALLISAIFLALVLFCPFLTVLAFILTWPFAELLSIPVTSDGLRLSTFILVIAFPILAAKALVAKDRDLFVTPFSKWIHVLILTLFIISLVSIVNSRNLKASLVEIQEFFYCVIINFFLVFNVKEKKDLEKIIAVFVGAGFLVSLIGIAEGLGWDVYSCLKYHSLFGSGLSSAILIKPAGRINGLIGDADFHGIYMGVVFLFSLYLFFKYRSKILRLFFSSVILLSVINIVGAASRSAVLGFIFSLLIFWSFIKLRFKWLISALMLGTILFLGFLMITFFPNLEIERLYHPTGQAKSTLELRKNNIMIGLAMSLDHPILGHGPDGFMIDYDRYAQRIPSAQTFETKPLNVYLQALVEYGIIGVTIFLSILGVALRSLFVLVKSLTGNDRYLPIIFLSILFGYAVFMTFAGGLINQCYWILIALSTVTSNISQWNIASGGGSAVNSHGVSGCSTLNLRQDRI